MWNLIESFNPQVQQFNMRYFWPQKVITTFLYHAVNNHDEDGRHIETLAFVSGRRDGDDVTATDIMFPQQEGSSEHVDDAGKIGSKLI